MCEWNNDRLPGAPVARRSHLMGQQSLLQVANISSHLRFRSQQFLKFHCFRRINLPNRKRRDRLKELERASPRESFIEVDVETASEASSEQDYSYEFAQMEVIMKTLGNNGAFWIIRLLRWTLSSVLSGHSCTIVGGPRFSPCYSSCIL